MSHCYFYLIFVLTPFYYYNHLQAYVCIFIDEKDTTIALVCPIKLDMIIVC